MFPTIKPGYTCIPQTQLRVSSRRVRLEAVHTQNTTTGLSRDTAGHKSIDGRVVIAEVARREQSNDPGCDVWTMGRVFTALSPLSVDYKSPYKNSRRRFVPGGV
jgi:hypothetical protein